MIWSVKPLTKVLKDALNEWIIIAICLWSHIHVMCADFACHALFLSLCAQFQHIREIQAGVKHTDWELEIVIKRSPTGCCTAGLPLPLLSLPVPSQGWALLTWATEFWHFDSGDQGTTWNPSWLVIRGKTHPTWVPFSVFLLHRQVALCSSQLDEAQQEEGVGWAQEIELSCLIVRIPKLEKKKKQFVNTITFFSHRKRKYKTQTITKGGQMRIQLNAEPVDCPT